jgi:hypothetical protein
MNMHDKLSSLSSSKLACALENRFVSNMTPPYEKKGLESSDYRIVQDVLQFLIGSSYNKRRPSIAHDKVNVPTQMHEILAGDISYNV